jgi:hypothetical protein
MTINKRHASAILTRARFTAFNSPDDPEAIEIEFREVIKNYQISGVRFGTHLPTIKRLATLGLLTAIQRGIKDRQELENRKAKRLETIEYLKTHPFKEIITNKAFAAHNKTRNRKACDYARLHGVPCESIIDLRNLIKGE